MTPHGNILFFFFFYYHIRHIYNIQILWLYQFFRKQTNCYSKSKTIKVVIFNQKQTKIFKYSRSKYANCSLVKLGDYELTHNMESYDEMDTVQNGRKV